MTGLDFRGWGRTPQSNYGRYTWYKKHNLQGSKTCSSRLLFGPLVGKQDNHRRTPKSLWRKSRTGGSTWTETRVILCLCPVSVYYHNRWLSKSLIRDLRKQPVGRKDHGLRKRLDTGVILFWHLPVLNYFMYKGHFYKQKYGPTDRLLSLTYSGQPVQNNVYIWLKQFEQKALETASCQSYIGRSLICKYDTFRKIWALYPYIIEKFHQHLNNMDPVEHQFHNGKRTRLPC